MGLTVAIIGRPNVGKSTLFNRLVGKRLALVDDRPGVTRDRREGEGRLADLVFKVIDTAGLEDDKAHALSARMRAQTEAAITQADLALLLIDARAGITPLDRAFAGWLRGKATPVLLVANKCEGAAGEAGLYDAFSLGLGAPLALSAEHGEGLAGLYQALCDAQGKAQVAQGDAAGEKPLMLAIIGRPNAGKSTLINRLIGEERLVTGPEAGITRDAIAIDWRWHDRAVRLYDTAGLRRRAKVTDKLEKLSAADSRRAIQFAEVVVLLLDGRLGLEKQDIKIAAEVAAEGRALIIAINKWDVVEDRQKTYAQVREELASTLAQLKDVPLITLSGQTGEGLDKLMPAVMRIHEIWNRRIATAPLNDWLDEALSANPPAAPKGKRVKIRYMTQVKTRPPSFILFVNRADAVPDSYIRYLMNGLRAVFDLPGVPLRLALREGKNPYHKKST
ncbi:MAG: ribosome biogenesis GTPase Der [Pseudomonadota bacterium]